MPKSVLGMLHYPHGAHLTMKNLNSLNQTGKERILKQLKELYERDRLTGEWKPSEPTGKDFLGKFSV